MEKFKVNVTLDVKGLACPNCFTGSLSLKEVTRWISHL